MEKKRALLAYFLTRAPEVTPVDIAALRVFLQTHFSITLSEAELQKTLDKLQNRPPSSIDLTQHEKQLIDTLVVPIQTPQETLSKEQELTQREEQILFQQEALLAKERVLFDHLFTLNDPKIASLINTIDQKIQEYKHAALTYQKLKDQIAVQHEQYKKEQNAYSLLQSQIQAAAHQLKERQRQSHTLQHHIARLTTRQTQLQSHIQQQEILLEQAQSQFDKKRNDIVILDQQQLLAKERLLGMKHEIEEQQNTQFISHAQTVPSIYALIHQAQHAIHTNSELAKSIYKQIQDQYAQLKPEQQQTIRGEILALHKSLSK